MDVALLTIGDELLSGDTENTNASWLARQLTARGATVQRILVVPDEQQLIADTIREWSSTFDAVITTGGLGGTHDDITMEAVAGAFGQSVDVNDAAREDVLETMAQYRADHPELVETYDLRVDPDAQASIPAGAEPLLNEVGLSPGCILETVFVLPGIPDEMRAMFDQIVDQFGGDRITETLYTPVPEGAMGETFAELHERFEIVAGSYPARRPAPNRIKLVGTDKQTVVDATAWLADRIETVAEPPQTDDVEVK